VSLFYIYRGPTSRFDHWIKSFNALYSTAQRHFLHEETITGSSGSQNRSPGAKTMFLRVWGQAPQCVLRLAPGVLRLARQKSLTVFIYVGFLKRAFIRNQYYRPGLYHRIYHHYISQYMETTRHLQFIVP
jgi:hypothetical protein